MGFLRSSRPRGAFGVVRMLRSVPVGRTEVPAIMEFSVAGSFFCDRQMVIVAVFSREIAVEPEPEGWGAAPLHGQPPCHDPYT